MMLFGCGGTDASSFWAWAESVTAAAGAGAAAGAAGAAGETEWVYDVLLASALTAFMEIPFTEDE